MQADRVDEKPPLFLWEATKKKKCIYLFGINGDVSGLPDEIEGILDKVSKVYMNYYYKYLTKYLIYTEAISALDTLSNAGTLNIQDPGVEMSCVRQIIRVAKKCYQKKLHADELIRRIDDGRPPAILAYEIFNGLSMRESLKQQGMNITIEHLCRTKGKKITGILSRKIFSEIVVEELADRVGKFHRFLVNEELHKFIQLRISYAQDQKQAYERGNLEEMAEKHKIYEREDIVSGRMSREIDRKIVDRLEKKGQKPALYITGIFCCFGEGNILELLQKKGWSIKRL